MADSSDTIPERFQLQYSKGWGKCCKCHLTRPVAQLAKEKMGDSVVVFCKDTVECARLSALREHNLRELPEQQLNRGPVHVPGAPLPEPEEKEIVAAPAFWNSSQLLI